MIYFNKCRSTCWAIATGTPRRSSSQIVFRLGSPESSTRAPCMAWVRTSWALNTLSFVWSCLKLSIISTWCGVSLKYTQSVVDVPSSNCNSQRVRITDPEKNRLPNLCHLSRWTLKPKASHHCAPDTCVLRVFLMHWVKPRQVHRRAPTVLSTDNAGSTLQKCYCGCLGNPNGSCIASLRQQFEQCIFSRSEDKILLTGILLFQPP